MCVHVCVRVCVCVCVCVCVYVCGDIAHSHDVSSPLQETAIYEGSRFMPRKLFAE